MNFTIKRMCARRIRFINAISLSVCPCVHSAVAGVMYTHTRRYNTNVWACVSRCLYTEARVGAARLVADTADNLRCQTRIDSANGTVHDTQIGPCDHFVYETLTLFQSHNMCKDAVLYLLCLYGALNKRKSLYCTFSKKLNRTLHWIVERTCCLRYASKELFV